MLVLGTAHALLLRPRADDEPLPGELRHSRASPRPSPWRPSRSPAGSCRFRAAEPVYGAFVAPVLAVATAVAVDSHPRAARRASRRGIVTGAVIGGLSIVAALVAWCSECRRSRSRRRGRSGRRMPSHRRRRRCPRRTWRWPRRVAIAVLLLIAPSLLASRTPRPADRRRAPDCCSRPPRRPRCPPSSSASPWRSTAAAVALARSRARTGWVLAGDPGGGDRVCGRPRDPVALADRRRSGDRAADRAADSSCRPGEEWDVALALAPVAVAVISAFIAPGALTAATGVAGDEWQVTIALLQWIALIALAVADRAAARCLEPPGARLRRLRC